LDNGFTLKVIDINSPIWLHGVNLQRMKDFLFEEVREPEKETWRFEIWHEANYGSDS